MLSSPLLSGAASGTLMLTLSTDTNNVNVIDELEAIYGAGSCSGKVKVVVTVLPGVTIWSNNATSWALSFNGFDYGASLKLVNYGNIYGKGGDGNSGAGGAAIRISRNITINNTTTGRIFGGGGGGGQGGYGQASGHPGRTGGGGGGGGGQGNGSSSGGEGQGGDTPGENGTGGTEAGPGTWGNGGYYSADAAGGRGGQGGGWGQQGEEGSDGYGSREIQGAGTVGGQPGKAIYKSSECAITWLAGNNATQVKGVVD